MSSPLILSAPGSFRGDSLALKGELWAWEPILMGATVQDFLRDFLKSPKGWIANTWSNLETERAKASESGSAEIFSRKLSVITVHVMELLGNSS